MERCIEHRHLRHLGQQLLHGLYAEQIGGIVQGGQFAQAPDALHHLVINHAGFREQLAAVGDPVTYGLYLVERLQDSVPGIRQKPQD